MDENNVNNVDYEEAMKQRKEDILAKGHYVHIELVITPDEKEQYATVELRHINSETLGKSILALKQTLHDLMEKADPAALMYLLTHDTTSKTTTIDKGGN